MFSIIEAANFAAEAHKDQRRKGDLSPYINHPIGVANIIQKHACLHPEDNTTPIILQAALLHDTVEDTDVTIDEIKKVFGGNVARYVANVTDDKSQDKVTRKKTQIEHAKTMDRGTAIIKLADKYYNCSDLMITPPKSWTPDIIYGYFVWTRAFIENLPQNVKDIYGIRALTRLHEELWKENNITFPDDLNEELQKYYALIQ